MFNEGLIELVVLTVVEIMFKVSMKFMQLACAVLLYNFPALVFMRNRFNKYCQFCDHTW